MKIAKRVIWFILMNIWVLLTITLSLTVIQSVFGINITAYGYNYQSVLIFAAIVWFSWAIISLFLSKYMAKSMYWITLVNNDNIHQFHPKISFVYRLAESISLSNSIKIPEVWIYESYEPNAFATWWSKNNSLLAVSTWLLETMDELQIEWVIWHEMSHILNGDMVTMTLLQWVLNTFVIFFSRIIGTAVDKVIFKNEDDTPGIWYFITSLVLELVFSIFASLVLMAYSRQREYRADEWSAKIVWKNKMISALQKLANISKNVEYRQDSLSSFKISSNWWIFALFSSHPRLEDRIKRLERI